MGNPRRLFGPKTLQSLLCEETFLSPGRGPPFVASPFNAPALLTPPHCIAGVRNEPRQEHWPEPESRPGHRPTRRSAAKTLREELSLRELGPTASTMQARLLTLFHSRITRQMSIFAKRWEQLGIGTNQSTGDSHAAGAGLACGSSSVN